MFKQLKGLIVCAVSICIILAGQVLAQENKDLSLEEQLKAIAQAQQRIEKKLSVIESQQKIIMRGVGSQRAGSRREVDYSKVYKIDIGKSPVDGPKNAKVTIFEFSEIECPYSKKFHPVINEVLKAYPKDVNRVFKHYPLNFHSLAKPGAKAMLAAGKQGKYYEMLELLFALDRKDLAEIKKAPKDQQAKKLEGLFKSLANKLGLKVKKFINDYKNKDAEWEKIIEQDVALGKKVGVRGTPTIFINGRKTRARNLQGFKREIDAVLKGEIPKGTKSTRSSRRCSSKSNPGGCSS